jgi:hypothetical protein
VPESDDLRQFIRDIAMRHERIWREQAEILHAMDGDMRELREESRAQTRALLHVLDRLENGGAAA